MKLGDANGDWKPSADTGSPLNTIHERAPASYAHRGPLLVLVGTRSDSEGDLHVPFLEWANEALMRLQYELVWDHRMLSLKGVTSNKLTGFTRGVHTYDQE